MVNAATSRRRERCIGDVVRGCRNPRRADELRCSRCKMRRWRANNPAQAAYATLRDHARSRGVVFTITFEEFAAVAWLGDYLENKGQAAHSLTVDRKDNRLGYIPGNIQPMTRAANSVKRNKYDAARMRAGFTWAAAHCGDPYGEEVSE